MGITGALPDKKYCHRLDTLRVTRHDYLCTPLGCPYYMCPACFFTIGGGLLIAKKLGVNDVLVIGLITVIFSIILDKLFRHFNKEKALFPYQKIIIPILILFISILVAKFLL